jgi:predicted ester cyclase
MNISPNKQIVQDFCTILWNKRDIDAASERLHDDTTYIGPRITVQGKTKYVELLRGYMSMLTESHFQIIDMIEENDKVFCHAELSGIHSEPYGEIPPTNKKVRFQLMSIVRIQNGKIISETEIFDEFGLMLEMGVEFGQKAHA